MSDIKKILNDVLGRQMTNEIWSGDYRKVLPIAIQHFDLDAILPAMFYMFRFGHRRGKGYFQEVFGNAGVEKTSGGKKVPKKLWSATIEQVSKKMASIPELSGFDGECEQAILGDMLLSFNLENQSVQKHVTSRTVPIARVFPSHYMASWIDLPDAVVHLRFVPEMIVALLADQDDELNVRQTKENDKTWFPVKARMEQNALLRPFYAGVSQKTNLSNPNSFNADQFNEDETNIGIDQLLIIRMAEYLKSAPVKLVGEQAKISNQRPIAEKASKEFSYSLRKFVQHYATIVPRMTFVEMLESCLSVGLLSILSNTINILTHWKNTGTVPQKDEQFPLPVLIDCSNGAVPNLRHRAEQSMDEFVRQLGRLPVILMILRILDYSVRNAPVPNLTSVYNKCKDAPYATELLNLLGRVHQKEEEQSQKIHDVIAHKAMELASGLEQQSEENEGYDEAAKILRGEEMYDNAVTKLAEVLIPLWGKIPYVNTLKLLDCSLMIGRPNGLATKRSVTRVAEGKRDVRSLVLTDSVLDYLVHIHLLPSGNKEGYRHLSFDDFLKLLREQYGFYVDQAPPNCDVSSDLLLNNRTILEKRLRDLGLLLGVNDAESMKTLQPRFQ